VSWLRRRKESQEPTGDAVSGAGEEGSLLGGTQEASAAARGSRGQAGAGDDSFGPAGPGGPAGAAGSGAQAIREGGPWDVSEAPDTDGLVDLGGLRLPGRDGMELRLEVEEESGRVIAATIQLGDSAVQLQAFAAPRSEGIWDEIRKEIAASVTRQGGTADEVPGPFGRELLARVPARAPDGSTSHQPARFAGIDGPRWFLRAVFHGAAVYQEAAAADLETLVRGVVVVRGGEAMAPRELLSLSLPDGAQTGNEPPADEGSGALRPPQRGPEITEVR
jgi:Protein of unknown function (DUF3710)